MLMVKKERLREVPSVCVQQLYMFTILFLLSSPVNVILAKCSDFSKITWTMALDPGWNNVKTWTKKGQGDSAFIFPARSFFGKQNKAKTNSKRAQEIVRHGLCVHEIERLRKSTKTEAPEPEPEREMNLKVGDLPLDDVSLSLGAAAQLQTCP